MERIKKFLLSFFNNGKKHDLDGFQTNVKIININNGHSVQILFYLGNIVWKKDCNLYGYNNDMYYEMEYQSLVKLGEELTKLCSNSKIMKCKFVGDEIILWDYKVSKIISINEKLFPSYK